jgi:hypothetical protein
LVRVALMGGPLWLSPRSGVGTVRAWRPGLSRRCPHSGVRVTVGQSRRADTGHRDPPRAPTRGPGRASAERGHGGRARSAAPPHRRTRRIPVAVWAMVIGAFAMGADKFIVAGVVREIATALNVTVGQVGHLLLPPVASPTWSECGQQPDSAAEQPSVGAAREGGGAVRGARPDPDGGRRGRARPGGGHHGERPGLARRPAAARTGEGRTAGAGSAATRRSAAGCVVRGAPEATAQPAELGNEL